MGISYTKTTRIFTRPDMDKSECLQQFVALVNPLTVEEIAVQYPDTVDYQKSPFDSQWLLSSHGSQPVIDIIDLYQFSKSFFNTAFENHKRYLDTEYKKLTTPKRINSKMPYRLIDEFIRQLNMIGSEKETPEHQLIKQTADLLKEHYNTYVKTVGLLLVKTSSNYLQDDNCIPYSVKKEALNNIFQKYSLVKNDLHMLKETAERLVFLAQQLVSLDPDKRIDVRDNPDSTNLDELLGFKKIIRTIEFLYKQEVDTLYEIDCTINDTLDIKPISVQANEEIKVLVEAQRNEEQQLIPHHTSQNRKNVPLLQSSSQKKPSF